MGGPSAPGRVEGGSTTFTMLPLGQGKARWSRRGYFVSAQEAETAAIAGDIELQDRLLAQTGCDHGVAVP